MDFRVKSKTLSTFMNAPVTVKVIIHIPKNIVTLSFYKCKTFIYFPSIHRI